jgi:beta-ureidopropionase
MSKKIRVATVSMANEFRNVKKTDDNFSYIERTIDEISYIRPDLIVLPEVFLIDGITPFPEIPLEKSQDFMAELSRKYSSCIVGSVYEKDNGKLYNTAFFYGKQGNILGKYRKIHPTEKEMEEEGVYPGEKKQQLVNIKGYKVGAQICFDANWQEDWTSQVNQGARLIVFLSAYPGGQILNSIALLNQVYIVSAVSSLHAGIIDNTGNWKVKTDRFSWWVWADINLERTVFKWGNQKEKLLKVREKYTDKVKIETFGPEAFFTIEPLDDEIFIDEIIKEFQLVTYRQHIERTARIQDEKRKTKTGLI